MSKNNGFADNYNAAYKKLKIVSHPLRGKILDLIRTNGEMNVTDIYSKLHLEQSVCSQMLSKLRQANAVITRREGKEIFYSVNESVLNNLNTLAVEIISL